jgi:fructose/tagatose bisphosphate aldolase
MAMNKRQAFHRAMLNKIKTDKGCETCGYNANPVALQFDHIDPETKFVDAAGKRLSPGSMISYSQSAILSEIAKCRVLCANCHAIHSFDQGMEMRANGTMRKGGRPKLSVVSDRLIA